MEYATIVVAAVAVSILTLYSGFGLGTLLMPVFALFLPVDVAVAATAIVHAANNVVKVVALGGGADRGLVLRFGLPAVVASFAGAGVLTLVSVFPPLATYCIGAFVAQVTPLKLSMGILILLFAFAELLPHLRDLRMHHAWLLPGGILSGFFGGFSGHQGALRSAFLVRTGGTPESFVATNAVIGMMVDGARLLVYGWTFVLTRHAETLGGGEWPLVIAGIVGAATGVLLLGIGLALACGIV